MTFNHYYLIFQKQVTFQTKCVFCPSSHSFTIFCSKPYTNVILLLSSPTVNGLFFSQANYLPASSLFSQNVKRYKKKAWLWGSSKHCREFGRKSCDTRARSVLRQRRCITSGGCFQNKTTGPKALKAFFYWCKLIIIFHLCAAVVSSYFLFHFIIFAHPSFFCILIKCWSNLKLHFIY